MNIRKIKNAVSSLKGMVITVIYYGSRNKREKYTGIVYKTYNNVFSIILKNGDIKCFSYIDLLTKNIKIVNKR